MAVHRGVLNTQILIFLQKFSNLEGKIENDLVFIICMNDIFSAILSFWNMIDFVFFFNTKHKFKNLIVLGGGLAPPHP